MPKNDIDPNEYRNNYAKKKSDSLDNYNDNLSKQAVGSIMDKITNKSNDDIEDNNNHEENTFQLDIDTNFKIKNDNHRKKLVSDFFDDDSDKPRKRSKPSQNTSHTTVSQPRPQRPEPPRLQNSPAFGTKAKDEDVKYVTRGNHTPLTPAMTAKRKKVTMMESQKIPIITDEDIANYKEAHSEKTIAYSNKDNKNTIPINYSTLENDSSFTSDQREIVEVLKQEQVEREMQLEDTLVRIDENNKRFRSILESTDKKLNRNDSNSGIMFAEESEDDLLNNLDISEEDLEKDFYETVNQSLDIKPIDEIDTVEDTFDENINPKSKPFIPTKNLNHKNNNKRKKHNPPTITDDYYDLETDTLVKQQSKYNTGEIKQINNTLATEISIDDLDDLVFENYDTTDMAFLRESIKEKSKALKLQEFDEKIEQFEREHRDFSNKSNTPSKYNKKPKVTTNQKPQTASTATQPQPKQHPLDDDYDSYSYHKTRRETSKHTPYDTSSFDTSKFSTDKLDAIESRYSTGERNISNTSKIKPVVVDAEIAELREEFSGKILISRIINSVLIVLVVIVSVYSFAKISDLNKSIETLTVTNTDLVAQNNKIAELQIDLNYYKDLYYSTNEGKANLENEAKAENIEGDDSSDDSNTGNSSSYTVVSGDTLSSISKKVYGTPNKYQQIIDANKLTTENLSVGQVLIIPE